MTTETLWTVNAIKSAVRSSGSHWFDPDTMRHFRCRIGDTVYQGPGGIYFVSSEHGPHGPRRYTVRQFTLPSGVDTVGDFNEMTRGAAITMAKRLAKTPLAQQWLEAIQAVDEATTGHKHGRTFNAAANYVSLADAQAGQVIHFPGDGGYTRAVAKEYTDGSGMYLELVETGATDRKKAWSDGYKLQREACRVLCTFASNSFSADLKAETETYAPVSILDQFIHDLRKHGKQDASGKDARKLISKAALHESYMVAHCNGEWPYGRDWSGAEEGTHPPVVERVRKELRKLAEAVGAITVILGGDPRGSTCKLVFADGHTNDFGKEGYCVPTSLKNEEE